MAEPEQRQADGMGSGRKGFDDNGEREADANDDTVGIKGKKERTRTDK